MSLKTNYRNDAFEGKRRYLLEDNGDGTWGIVDATNYAVSGDIFNSDDINATNIAVNNLEAELEKTNRTIGSIEDALEKVQTITLTTSGWSPAPPYKQRVNIPGLKASDAPTPGMIYPDGMSEEQKQLIDKCSDMITDMETFDGYIEVTCRFKKPITNLIIGLKGR